MANRPSRKRPAPTKISKPFPWGMAAGSALLAAALVGILVYAAMNQGQGFEDPIEKADKSFPAITVSDDLAREHVQGDVDYPTVVPFGGEHNPLPQQCGVYDEQIAAEHAVHSLEHGAVWVTYRPDLPDEQVEKLTDEVEGNPYGLLSPQPGQDAPILLTAWGRQVAVQDAEDERISDLINTYASGPQTPERGAACAGTTTTGATPVGTAPDGSVPPPASPVPSPSASGPAPSPPASAPAGSPAASPAG